MTYYVSQAHYRNFISLLQRYKPSSLANDYQALLYTISIPIIYKQIPFDQVNHPVHYFDKLQFFENEVYHDLIKLAYHLYSNRDDIDLAFLLNRCDPEHTRIVLSMIDGYKNHFDLYESHIATEETAIADMKNQFQLEKEKLKRKLNLAHAAENQESIDFVQKQIQLVNESIDDLIKRSS